MISFFVVHHWSINMSTGSRNMMGNWKEEVEEEEEEDGVGY